MKTTTVEVSKFMSKVDTSGDCWVWTGVKNPHGYGRGYDCDTMKTQYAHRISFEIFYGEKPEEILHECDNTSCVKPTHLRAGTHVENMRDMAAKARGNTAKLTADQVREIREIGEMRGLAKRYGVSRHTIRQIIKRETWKDVK